MINYAHPEVLVSTDWVDSHRNDPGVRLSEVDVDAKSYAEGHIPGALSVPVDELQQRLRRLPKSKAYVAYCRGPYCVYADRAVEILQASGRRAQRLAEGFPEWKAAGFPVETGADGGALTR